ncbi:unnamed protein product [Spirodela intermedia]|uniref:Uncharacterized protein n=1 Tax=Spirodela intermedia TaxID=51605 RepID=A0A7I8KJ45_SPIIN|nr:unnamed protein product [Spirodela intermedia]
MAGSPKSGGGDGDSGSSSGKAGAGSGAQCLCSPTTHRGSFRCRHHRSSSSAWSRRSDSLPADAKGGSSISQKLG